MNILFISSSNIVAGNVAYLLKKEGHEVKLFIDDKYRKSNFDNLVEKTLNWRKELRWVGKKGLIIFDDIGYGRIQDQLRKKGYSVFGGSNLGDKLESDREHAQEIFKKFGLEVMPTQNFESIDDCIKYVKRNKKAWVVKQNDHASKLVNYVSAFNNGRDILDILNNYKKRRIKNISIQQRVDGIEIGVGRYFNGSDWVGPIEINIEHKKFFPEDLGPSTSEMGTVAWYDDNENNKLFRKTIFKLKPYLQKINFRGDFEINCIINKKGVFPLEATPRLGSPIIYLQTEIHKSPWGEFLKAVADGRRYNLKWKRGFGIVILLAVPPFPYAKRLPGISLEGVGIYFKEKMSYNEFKHIHFEGVALRKKGGKDEYYISDGEGYVLYSTAVAQNFEEARRKAYKLIRSVHAPKSFFRNDIGAKFIKEDQKTLKKLGYL